MVKTANEVERDFHRMISSSSLAVEISGNVCRGNMRPYDSKTEDIVVKFLSGTDDQIQTGVVVINIYVPDRLLSDGPVTRYVPDMERIGQLQRLVLDFIRDYGHGEYKMESDSTATAQPLKEIGQHYINARIKFKRYSD